MSQSDPDTSPEALADRELTAALEAAKQALAAADTSEVRPPDPDLVRALAGAAVRLVARQGALGNFEQPPLGDPEPSPTEVAIAVLNLLAAADIELPEIAMWQAMGLGAPPAGDAETAADATASTTSTKGRNGDSD